MMEQNITLLLFSADAGDDDKQQTAVFILLSCNIIF